MTTKQEVKRNIMRKIMELRTKGMIEEDCILDVLDDNLDPYIDELEKENRRLLESCKGATMMYKDLQKAKELLTRFVMASVYFNGKETDLVEEAEHFLKGTEE